MYWTMAAVYLSTMRATFDAHHAAEAHY
jgi:hypothetical protein